MRGMDIGSIYDFVLSLISFWALLNIIYISRKEWFVSRGIKLYYGVVLIYKKPYDVKPSPLVSKVSYVSIPLALIGIYMFYSAMIMSLISKLGVLKTGVTVQLLIPGINITGIFLLYFAIAVVIAAAAHEFAHAYVARSHNIPVKGLGFAIILFVPIAFTEIDEESFPRASKKARILTLSAGPASNIALALFFMVLLIPLVSSYGYIITNVVENSLAEHIGLKPGYIILKVNGTQATLQALHSYLSLNKTVRLILTVYIPQNNSLVNISFLKPASTHLLGVYLQASPSLWLIKSVGINMAEFIVGLTQWIYLVNMSLGIINIAPLFITDGGRIVYEIIGSKTVSHIINILTLLILVLALAP